MKQASPVLPGHENLIPETVFGEGQPQYQPLPAVIVPGPEGEVITRWEFSEEDRAAIAAGASLYLSVLTFGRTFHPVLLRIASPEEILAEPRRVDAPVQKRVLHKDLPGEHTQSEDCWCGPSIVVNNPFASSDDVIQELDSDHAS